MPWPVPTASVDLIGQSIVHVLNIYIMCSLQVIRDLLLLPTISVQYLHVKFGLNDRLTSFDSSDGQSLP